MKKHKKEDFLREDWKDYKPKYKLYCKPVTFDIKEFQNKFAQSKSIR